MLADKYSAISHTHRMLVQEDNRTDYIILITLNCIFQEETALDYAPEAPFVEKSNMGIDKFVHNRLPIIVDGIFQEATKLDAFY